MNKIVNVIICIFFIGGTHESEGQLKITKVKTETTNYNSSAKYLKQEARIDLRLQKDHVNAEVVDTTGNYLVETVLDGNSGGYYFYSKNHAALSQYRPYGFFASFRHDVSGNDFAVAAVEQLNSPKFKIAWLTVAGKLEKEKEFEKKFHWLQDIKIVNHKFLVVAVNSRENNSTLMCYDRQLEVKWVKPINEFILYFGLLPVDGQNSIIVLSRNGILCIDAATGNETWNVPREQIHHQDHYIPMNGNLIFAKKYLGVITYETVTNDRHQLVNTINNKLSVLSLASGEILYEEQIGLADSDLSIIKEHPVATPSDYFLLKDKNNVWKYSLAE